MRLSHARIGGIGDRVLPWVLATTMVALWMLASNSPTEPLRAQGGPSETTPTVRPTATATVSPGEGLCVVSGEQIPAAPWVERWLPLTMHTVLDADCPVEGRARADIMLLLDRSSSMGEDGKYEAAGEAVRQFVDNIDFARHRVGLIPFEDDSWVAQPLTDRADRLLRALDDLEGPSGGTNIGKAIAMAEQELRITGRTSAVGVVVLLTDGRQSSAEGMLEAAERARRAGIVIFVIGLGDDADHLLLQRVTDDVERYYRAPSAEDLDEVYRKIASILQEFRVTDVALYDRLAPGVEHLPGTGRPDEPEEVAGAWSWQRAFLTDMPVTFTHRVQVARIGTLSPTARLWAEYTDGDGTRRRIEIQRAVVEVRPPVIRTIHLPFAAKRWCFPSPTHADVALVIDVSSSMRGVKLRRAVDGAKAFIDRLDLSTGADRAAIVRYDATADVVFPLASDRGALHAALDGLVPGQGTRLDRGLAAGADALAGSGDPDRRRVIVLLSDGRQSEGRGLIALEAADARSRGIQVHAVALGDDADLDVLADVAGAPSRLWVAPDAAALVEVYREVAGAVGCR